MTLLHPDDHICLRSPALELLVLLLIYARFTIFNNYLLETLSVWLLVTGWLFSPLIFNPNGLDNQAVHRDFDQWLTWLYSNVEVRLQISAIWTARKREINIVAKILLPVLLL